MFYLTGVSYEKRDNFAKKPSKIEGAIHLKKQKSALFEKNQNFLRSFVFFCRFRFSIKHGDIDQEV